MGTTENPPAPPKAMALAVYTPEERLRLAATDMDSSPWAKALVYLQDLRWALGKADRLREALVALVDAQPYFSTNPDSPRAEAWEAQREAALDLAAKALDG